MGIRLVVGRQTLNLQAVVRTHDPQPGQRYTDGPVVESGAPVPTSLGHVGQVRRIRLVA